MSSDEDFGSDDFMQDYVDDDNVDDDFVYEDDPSSQFVDDFPRDTELSRQKSFEVLSQEKIAKITDVALQEVMEICGLPSKTQATTLLRHYNWNKDKVIQDYTGGNQEEILKKVGITSFELEKELSQNEKDKMYDCLICSETSKGQDTFALACGHRYCKNCWKYYLEFKIDSGTNSVWTHCPYPYCNEMVHDNAFKDLISDNYYQTYRRHVERSLVEDNPHIKFCPAPNCTNAIKSERKGRKEAVVCGCGFRWCFQCADFEVGDHMPATCENVEAWIEKASDESENVKWMIANTKKCPTCRKPIEKNGGCMHMTCRKDSGGCGFEFCWLCRGNWKDHGADTGGYYACNKYDSSTAKQDDTSAQQIKTELEAYMFYFHRYESHHNAMKIANEQRRHAENRANELLEKLTVRAQDTNFLKEATEQLLENRRVLKWSYVYGFYLEKSKAAEKSLFEYLQEDLEKHTNHLSTLYETPTEKVSDYSNFMKWKEEVTNYTRVTAGFLKKFVEGVMGGLTVQD